MCIYRDVKNVERFVLAIQCLTCLCVSHLKNVKSILGKESDGDEDEVAKDQSDSGMSSPKMKKEERMNAEEMERMLQFMAKVFMLQFPLYSGPKQAALRGCIDEVSANEAAQLAVYCDVGQHDLVGNGGGNNLGGDSNFPIILLRNVTLFCNSGGLQGMADCFKLEPDLLPLSLSHALISVLCNIKLWLNYRALVQLFSPVRTNALNFMCQLSDNELRTPTARHIADFLWSSGKEHLVVDGGMVPNPTGGVGGSSVYFDKDGLELAYKYFNSTTLTMRLAGITQINSQINLFNEICQNSGGNSSTSLENSLIEVESVGFELAAWILNNKIVEHIFGPNLHVEVIKQSHILLNFLAVEGKITNDHMTVIWQASQLKHCSKQVHDLLLPLIKNLEAGPVLNLYELLKALPVKEHTEQTIHLAQVLQKFIWTSGGTFNHLLSVSESQHSSVSPHHVVAAGLAAATAEKIAAFSALRVAASSSDEGKVFRRSSVKSSSDDEARDTTAGTSNLNAVSVGESVMNSPNPNTSVTEENSADTTKESPSPSKPGPKKTQPNINSQIAAVLMARNGGKKQQNPCHH